MKFLNFIQLLQLHPEKCLVESTEIWLVLCTFMGLPLTARVAENVMHRFKKIYMIYLKNLLLA